MPLEAARNALRWVGVVHTSARLSGFGQSLERDREPKLLDSSGQVFCQSVRVAAVKVIGSKILVGQPIFDHEVSALQDRARHCHQGPFLSASARQALVHGPYLPPILEPPPSQTLHRDQSLVRAHAGARQQLVVRMERPGQTSVQALSTINKDDLGLDERHRGDCSALRAASKGIFMLGGERKFMKTSVKLHGLLTLCL